MASEEIHKLSSLLKEAKKPNQKQKDTFCTLWRADAGREGLSSELLSFLIDGYRFDPQDALVGFLEASAQSEAELKTVYSFFDGARTANECRAAAAAALTLLASQINQGRAPSTMAECADNVRAILSKGAYPNPAATVRKYFVAKLRRDVPSEVFADERFMALMTVLAPLLREMLSGAGVSKTIRARAQKLLEAGTASPAADVPASAPNAGPSTSFAVGAASGIALSDAQVPELLRIIAAKYEDLLGAAGRASRSTADVPQPQQISDAGQQDPRMIALLSENQELRFRCEQLTDKLKERENDVSVLKEELEQTSGLVDVVERDLSARANAQVQKIADALQHEYTDYMDGKDLDMDIDLGENMRDQLKRVFDVLRRNGLTFR